MSFLIHLNEAVQGRRRVPFWIVQSNGTTVDTGAAGDPVWLSKNGGALAVTNNTLSGVSAAQGSYYLELDQAEVDTLGWYRLSYLSGNFPQNAVPVQVVATDPFDSVMVSDSDRTLRGGSTSVVTLASAETTRNDWCNGAMIAFQYQSGDIVYNIVDDYNGSDRSVALKNALPLAPDSRTTYWIFGGTPETDLSAETILGVAASGQSAIADALLTRNISAASQGNRDVRSALRAIRNRVDASTSVYTVYQEDDSTSAYTGSLTTGNLNGGIDSVNPAT